MTRPQDYNRSPIVLLADDNPADQEIARRVLGSGVFHCELHTVSDGVEALDYLQRTLDDSDTYPRPDLLLLDINMPKRSGIDVLSHENQLGLRVPAPEHNLVAAFV